MTRRPTAAVYRRRRIVVGLGAVAIVLLLIWLADLAIGAVSGTDSASGSSSVNPSVSAPTVAVTVAPIGGKCDASDIVVKPVAAMAHVNAVVALKFQVFTKTAAECVWKVSHTSVQVRINAPGVASFWNTVSCPKSIREQTVTLHQRAPLTLTLANWNGHASSQASGCGAQNRWAFPGSYGVYSAALGGNPSFGALEMVAPGVRLVQPKPSVSATATPSATASTTPSSTASTTAATG